MDMLHFVIKVNDYNFNIQAEVLLTKHILAKCRDFLFGEMAELRLLQK